MIAMISFSPRLLVANVDGIDACPSHSPWVVRNELGSKVSHSGTRMCDNGFGI